MIDSYNRSKDNTVGRLSKVDQNNFAYIAGFLDGDGSIMLQLHRRKSGKDVFRVKTVVCFYQDKRHIKQLEWFKEVLGCGYMYTRSDGISELRVEGFQRVFEVLSKLEPFVRFKSMQVNLMLNIIPKLQQKLLLREETVSWIKKMREYNYFSSQRTTLEDVPVTT
ncbi:MAG: LAGLIDADG family homing endonuclease [bacterium]|nr:LAGLIDADG family homing endonuclease [bacterium]